MATEAAARAEQEVIHGVRAERRRRQRVFEPAGPQEIQYGGDVCAVRSDASAQIASKCAASADCLSRAACRAAAGLP